MGEPNYKHGTAEKIGVLLVNLGTPETPTTTAVRRYLKQFLSDPKVVETPQWLWQILLNFIILPRRSPKSAAQYQKIWTDKGSPLMTISRAQQQAVAQSFSGLPIVVELGMSYGKPSLQGSLRRLREENCRRLVVLPLYPQYAGCTVGSVFSAVVSEINSWRWTPHLRFISGYSTDSRYISVLADSITEFRRKNGTAEMLIFSFHGTPLAMLKDGDPYFCFCHQTARQTAEKLKLNDTQWRVTFQSQFGRAEWLKPNTIDTMRTMPEEGIKSAQIVAPAFAVDCLETLEEIVQENCKVFTNSGGQSCVYIPALNDSPTHIKFLQALIQNNIGDWLQMLPSINTHAYRVEALKKEQGLS